MRPKNGRFTRGPPFFLRSATCSFFGVAYTGFCSFSVALRWRYFSKNASKKWAIYTGTPFFLRSDVCSFLGRLTRGFCSFSVALFVFLNLPLGRFIRGLPFFSLLRHLFFFGRGSSFFLRFQCGAVLYFRCMALYERRFGFAVSWLCECRLSHLGGGVNKKTHCPAGGPQIGNRPGLACGVLASLSRVGSEDVKLGVAASRDG